MIISVADYRNTSAAFDLMLKWITQIYSNTKHSYSLPPAFDFLFLFKIFDEILRNPEHPSLNKCLEFIYYILNIIPGFIY